MADSDKTANIGEPAMNGKEQEAVAQEEEDHAESKVSVSKVKINNLLYV